MFRNISQYARINHLVFRNKHNLCEIQTITTRNKKEGTRLPRGSLLFVATRGRGNMKGLFGSKQFHRNFGGFHFLEDFPVEFVWFVGLKTIGTIHMVSLHAILKIFFIVFVITMPCT
jgi:hypothetical protein